jgi:hypothetical protein
MLKLSITNVAISVSVITVLALLVLASPLVWVASIATDLFSDIFPARRPLKLAPVEARSDE